MSPTPIKYEQLLDKTWVLEQLKTKSIAQLAKEIGAPRSSVDWMVKRYCSDAEQTAIVVERRHTKKDKITRVTKDKESQA